MAPKQPRPSQRASSMIERLQSRTLAPVPDLPAVEPAPAAPAPPADVEPERPAKRSRTAAAMPAEQPRNPRKTAAPAAAPAGQTFPNRITQTMSWEATDALDSIRSEENRKLRAAGHEQVYTITGLIRAAVDVCLSDPKLTARMVKAAGEPRLSGRGGIGTRR